MTLRRLCPHATDPAMAPDKVFIETELEAEDFVREPPPRDPARLRVVAWNLERGLELAGQIELLCGHAELRLADVLLLSEADRGCARTGGRHVARELAQALGMRYVFGVQYVELPRRCRRRVHRVDAPCEHGNAVLSRYPLEDPELLRHRRTVSWYGHRIEPRLGGCATLRATLRLGGRRLDTYAVHLDSGLRHDRERASQAAELVADADARGMPSVLGGDFNTYGYTLDVLLGLGRDPTVRTFREAGFRDAHRGLPARRRGTTSRRYLVRGVIDLILSRGLAVRAAGVVRAPGLSDHFPVWAELEFPERGGARSP